MASVIGKKHILCQDVARHIGTSNPQECGLTSMHVLHIKASTQPTPIGKSQQHRRGTMKMQGA